MSLHGALRLLALALVVVLVVLVAPCLPCLASRGDESTLFRSCVRQCLDADTDMDTGGDMDGGDTAVRRTVPACVGSAAQLPALWDCDSECKYRCMWEIETKRSGRVDKYYGKWPFTRLGPMQEPASVALSIANLAANAHCLMRLLGLLDFRSSRDERASITSDNSRAGRGSGKGWKQNRGGPERPRKKLMVLLWALHFALAVNAWTWSSVFHSRDLRATERLDYFSAGAVMVYDVYLSCLRVSGVSNGLAKLGALTLLVIGYARHMMYMHFVKFDYGYHVGLCVAAGILQSMMWIGWLSFSSEGRSHSGRRSLWAFVIGVNAAVLLEILDFPPVWHVVDAHALWHLCTVPLTYVLWGFVSKDVAAVA